MIYVTGDTHGNFHRFASGRCIAQDGDYVIICGDFGGIWNRTKSEEYWLDWLGNKPFTTLFVDGNHENFDILLSDQYPTVLWSGGKAKFIRPNVIYLMRGQVFEIEGQKIFTMGGARSHDISGGILDPDADDYIEQLYRARRSPLPFRVKHLSWWEQEMHSPEDQSEGLLNLERNNWTVDYIISHCAPTSIQKVMLGSLAEQDCITDYFEEFIAPNTHFKRWYFGHYHENGEVEGVYTVLYERILPIDYAG